MTDFQLTVPGVWTWRDYVIEEELDASGETVWFMLTRNNEYLWDCETFDGAVAAAEAEAAGGGA